MSWLRHQADTRTLAYMLIATSIPVVHWHMDTLNVWLLAVSVVMAFAISAMHHNHQHLPLWKLPFLNRLTDGWYVLFQGHPGFVFDPMHVNNHHRYHNGPADHTRTWRRRDSNNVLGLLVHPFEFVAVALPHIAQHAKDMYQNDRAAFARVCEQYMLLIAVDAMLLALDAGRAFYCVLVPQVAALFFLLASNYLQHAHTDGSSKFNHSRNFLGLINPLCFNVGYHSAHHFDSTKHWSELPALHRAIAPDIAPLLNEKSFGWYCLRVFVLSVVMRRFRSAPMLKEV